MDFCWALPVVATTAYDQLCQAYIDQSQRAERHHFDSVLLSLTPTSVDPFVMGTGIGLNTTSIRILIAQNTNHLLPTYTAKAVNTLNALIGDRVDINVVTGSAALTLSKDSKPDTREVRYARTKEYMDVLQRLRRGITTYTGDFYHLENCNIYPKENPDKRSRYFVAGSSEEAMQAAGEHGDAYILYACDRKSMAAHFRKVRAIAATHARTVTCGVLVDIIARETTGEAWEAARELLDQTPEAVKRLTKLFIDNADSVGLTRYKSLGSDTNYMVDNYLWGGLSVINPSNAVAIVGSYEEVRATLSDFQDAGADYILVASLQSESELERIGNEVVRPLKEEQSKKISCG